MPRHLVKRLCLLPPQKQRATQEGSPCPSPDPILMHYNSMREKGEAQTAEPVPLGLWRKFAIAKRNGLKAEDVTGRAPRGDGGAHCSARH